MVKAGGHGGGLGGVAPSSVRAWHSWHSCHHVMIGVAQPYGGSLSSTILLSCYYSTFVKTLLITSKARKLKDFVLVSFMLI